MKNKLKLIAVFFTTLFVLLGCGKEESSSFELNQNGVNSVLTYYYNNDLVTKQTATNTYDLKQLGVTEEDAKKQIEALNLLLTQDLEKGNNEISSAIWSALKGKDYVEEIIVPTEQKSWQREHVLCSGDTWMVGGQDNNPRR